MTGKVKKRKTKDRLRWLRRGMLRHRVSPDNPGQDVAAAAVVAAVGVDSDPEASPRLVGLRPVARTLRLPGLLRRKAAVRASQSGLQLP